MKKLAPIFLMFAIAACRKNDKMADAPIVTNAPSTQSDGQIFAEIAGRQWKSSKKASSAEYLASFNSGTLQIKTFGSFVDSSGIVSEDQLAIYVEKVSDTGVYSLSMSNYIVYNQLSNPPKYYSTQTSNNGKIHITNLTDSTVSGKFECTVDNTSGEESFLIREGSFADVTFQK